MIKSILQICQHILTECDVIFHFINYLYVLIFTPDSNLNKLYDRLLRIKLPSFLGCLRILFRIFKKYLIYFFEVGHILYLLFRKFDCIC